MIESYSRESHGNPMNIEIAPKSTEIQANWDDARLYCFGLNIDGKIGWRLPTREELNEIYKSLNDFKNYWHYWSSTDIDDGNRSHAWSLNFERGNLVASHKKYRGIYVRAVRSID